MTHKTDSKNAPIKQLVLNRQTHAASCPSAVV